ncbi:non-specific lipid transfer protein GPI-anchored 2-like [Momordica charantia]|uniref:Non-specific lipid transfer protein GPI-anchored 2-like n=1 Tax=Momordica charantia TaxID=3673 RepID=A0A6J1CAD6_MOMCH|nr:non-specific lipid transfer protein GPI-anchored 2-like [Momordica charantia]
MQLVNPFSRLALVLLPMALMAFLLLLLPVNGQINMPCSASMLSSFTPCLNFVTNSTGNGTSPTADCCNALRSLASGGRDCLCLIVTGRVPFQIPINRTLAVSLPRACNLPGVPLQCNAAAAPVPAPGPIPLGPALSPESSPSPSVTPQAPEPTTPDLSPAAENPSFPVGPEAPTGTAGSRPVLTPSAAVASNSFSPSVLLLGFAVLIFKFN